MAIAGAIIAVVGLVVSAKRSSKARKLASQQRAVDQRTAGIESARSRRIEFARTRTQQQRLLARQKAQGFQSSGVSGQRAAAGTQGAEAAGFSQTVTGFADQRRSSLGNINAFNSTTANINAGFGAASQLAFAVE